MSNEQTNKDDDLWWAVVTFGRLPRPSVLPRPRRDFASLARDVQRHITNCGMGTASAVRLYGYRTRARAMSADIGDRPDAIETLV